VQFKTKSSSQVRAGLKAFAIVAKDCFDKNLVRMEGSMAVTAYNLSLSLPDLTHLTGWQTEWDAHIVEITPEVEDLVTTGMLNGEQRHAGLQAMINAVQ
jgi:hypothetical protein